MKTTIIHRMFEHANSTPQNIAFRFLNDLSNTPIEITFQELWQESSAIARHLQKLGNRNDRVMLFFPPGLSYVKAFYGCLMAGMVAVPLYPPRKNVKSDRIIKVAQSCQSTIALTTESEITVVKTSWEEQNTLGLPLEFHAVDQIRFREGDTPFDLPVLEYEKPAFLQYTSGSTGVPKGVMVTHENIVANCVHLSLMSSGNKDDIFVNWLPLFHDLGLVTAVLWPVYLGAPSTLMAPANFVREPAMWLKAITKYRGSMCGAPNFAYDLCSDKISDNDLDGLDLSSWRVCYNAAEPVRAETLNRFAARFKSIGFNENAFYPSFGMAEATACVTGVHWDIKPHQLHVNKKALANNVLEVVDDKHPQMKALVSCGTALEPHDLKIVDPESLQALKDGEVGEIWFSGPSVSPGYWQLQELSSTTFNQKIQGDGTQRGYMRTGDLGLIYQGELYVTGRIKDLIILRGRNYYPQDIEATTAKAHSAIRSGYVAAFSVVENDVEQLAVVAEIEREVFRSINADEVVQAIRHQIALDHEIAVSTVVLLRPYKIPVTSSGKIRRKQTKQMLLDGELEAINQLQSAESHRLLPQTQTEQRLLLIWEKALKNPSISIADNFFEIGGDSISGVDIIAGIKKEFDQLELDINAIQEVPTIAAMAQKIDLLLAYRASVQKTSSSARTTTLRI